MSDTNDIQVEAGALLLASGALQDPNFARSVVLLCEHNDEGSFGLVLNHVLPLRLSDGFPALSGWDAPLYRGGPVQASSLHFLHTCIDVDLGSREVLPGVFWGGSFEEADRQIQIGAVAPEAFRFFAGYSGWGEGQLDTELQRKDWYVTPAQRSLVFHDDADQLWRTVLRQMGSEYAIYANFPKNPQLN